MDLLRAGITVDPRTGLSVVSGINTRDIPPDVLNDLYDRLHRPQEDLEREALLADFGFPTSEQENGI